MNWSVISIDEANFLLTLPTTDMLPIIEQADWKANKPKPEPFEAGPFAITLDNGQYFLCYLYEKNMHLVNLQKPSNSKPVYSRWRPALIPLDKKGQYDVSFFDANPPGTILSGGAMYQNGTAKLPFGEQQALKNGSSPILLGDTSEGIPQLEWVVADGALVCMSELATMRPIDLLMRDICYPPYWVTCFKSYFKK